MLNSVLMGLYIFDVFFFFKIVFTVCGSGESLIVSNYSVCKAHHNSKYAFKVKTGQAKLPSKETKTQSTM